MLDQIPDLRKKSLTEKLTVPIEPELKREIMELKSVHGKDHLEWIRQILRSELQRLKQSIAA